MSATSLSAESTHSMRLPIEEYDVDENAGVGAWGLLEPIALPAAQDQHVGVRRSGREAVLQASTEPCVPFLIPRPYDTWRRRQETHCDFTRRLDT